MKWNTLPTYLIMFKYQLLTKRWSSRVPSSRRVNPSRSHTSEQAAHVHSELTRLSETRAIGLTEDISVGFCRRFKQLAARSEQVFAGFWLAKEVFAGFRLAKEVFGGFRLTKQGFAGFRLTKQVFASFRIAKYIASVGTCGIGGAWVDCKDIALWCCKEK